MQQITVATSIAPFNIPHQQGAVRSWHQLGLSVISLNIPDEIAKLEASFPDVRFVPVQRTGKELAGRPFVFFDDVLNALWESGSAVCGIINSDIYLNCEPDFVELMHREAPGSLVFGSRIDVESLQAHSGEENSWGFDVYFFDRALTQIYPKTDFCLGVPWWDYWCPVVPVLRGWPVKHLISDVALHLIHDANWSIELYKQFGQKCIGYLEGENGTLVARARVGTRESETSYLSHAVVIVTYFLSNAEKLYYPERAVATVRGDTTPLETLPQTRELLRCLEKTQDITAAPAEDAELHRELKRVKGSLSWKLTKPLRWLKGKL